MNHFHSGDLGDIIYSLPTIRALGGGTLTLCPGQNLHGMDQARANLIIPLLARQNYIKEVTWIPERETSLLSKFREGIQKNTNLAHAHMRMFSINPKGRMHKWLDVGRGEDYGITVFSRSARYHNPRFPWRDIINVYGHNAVFLGTPEEHSAFVNEFDIQIPYHKTPDLLAAASTINDAKLFVGNQSCLAAIAEGLKKKMILEVYPPAPNCIFNRFGRINGWDDNFEFNLDG